MDGQKDTAVREKVQGLFHQKFLGDDSPKNVEEKPANSAAQYEFPPDPTIVLQQPDLNMRLMMSSEKDKIAKETVRRLFNEKYLTTGFSGDEKKEGVAGPTNVLQTGNPSYAELAQHLPSVPVKEDPLIKPQDSRQVPPLEIRATPVSPPPSLPPTDVAAREDVAKSLRNADPKTKEIMTAWDEVGFLKRLLGGNGIVPLDVSVAASPPDIQQAVHLDEAVAFALSNNFEVHAATAKSRVGYWNKMGAYSEYLPSIEWSYASGTERSKPGSYNDASGTRVLDTTHHRYDKNFVLRQPLIDLSIVADILSSRNKENIEKINLRDVQEGIAYDTVSAFLNLLQARVTVQLADQYKRYLEDLAERMKSRVEGGGATAADLERIQGREASADAARIEALGSYETNIAEFVRLTKIRPSQLAFPDNLAPDVPQNQQEAIDRALQANPSYKSSLTKIDAAVADRNKSYSGLLPKLSMQYSKAFSYNAGGSANGNPVDGVYPSQSTQSLMLVAQWSLSGGTSVASGLAGAAKTSEMNFRSQDVRARLEQGVRSGYTAMNAARSRLSVLKKAVQANENVVAAFEEQYKGGARSLFDILDAYEQLYNSRLNLMRVTIASAQAAYQVRRQMGDLIESVKASGTAE